MATSDNSTPVTYGYLAGILDALGKAVGRKMKESDAKLVERIKTLETRLDRQEQKLSAATKEFSAFIRRSQSPM